MKRMYYIAIIFFSSLSKRCKEWKKPQAPVKLEQKSPTPTLSSQITYGNGIVKPDATIEPTQSIFDEDSTEVFANSSHTSLSLESNSEQTLQINPSQNSGNEIPWNKTDIKVRISAQNVNAFHIDPQYGEYDNDGKIKDTSPISNEEPDAPTPEQYSPNEPNEKVNELYIRKEKVKTRE